MRRGVLGGTFDPVHAGHLALAEHAVRQIGLGQVLWIPAGDPWQKAGTHVTAGEHRLAMVRLAVADRDAFAVSTVELDREGPTYTVDTLLILRDEHPDDDLVLLLGDDALRDLPNWREPERLLQVATFAVAAREGRRPAAGELDRRVLGLGERVTWIDMPQVAVSATDVRRRASEAESLRGLVPETVEAYIAEHGLYRPS